MSLTTQIKNELNQLGVKPKKSLGQNFLINEGVYKKIVATLELKPGETVVEVGPGLGTLTQLLLDAGTKVIAVEKDCCLAEYLKTKFANTKNVTITEGDILNFDPKRYTLNVKRFKVVGNIPYYLTSHLLRTIFEKWSAPELVVLMLQKEVAQRIMAKPPKMSLLSVSVQYYAEPKIISYVSSGSFYPPPKVDSAIIRLGSKPETRNYEKDQKFFKVVKTGFAGKRKQLLNNIASGLKIPKNTTEEKLKKAGVDPKRRAETLTLNEWKGLADTFLPLD